MRKDIEKIFRGYVAVQFSGWYNMFMQCYKVREFLGINEEDYFYIIDNYSMLKEKYPMAWEQGKKIGLEMNEQINS